MRGIPGQTGTCGVTDKTASGLGVPVQQREHF